MRGVKIYVVLRETRHEGTDVIYVGQSKKKAIETASGPSTSDRGEEYDYLIETWVDGNQIE